MRLGSAAGQRSRSETFRWLCVARLGSRGLESRGSPRGGGDGDARQGSEGPPKGARRDTHYVNTATHTYPM